MKNSPATKAQMVSRKREPKKLEKKILIGALEKIEYIHNLLSPTNRKTNPRISLERSSEAFPFSPRRRSEIFGRRNTTAPTKAIRRLVTITYVSEKVLAVVVDT